MKKTARELRSISRNRIRTRSWTKKGLRSKRLVKPKSTIYATSKKDVVVEVPIPYTQIDCNEFIHRRHKQLSEDDIPICSCKVVKGDIDSACGDRCLNFLTSNECTPGFCPCGELCKNQRFQRRMYIETKLVKTDERGWGLIVNKNVKGGEFVIEYCGEVISCEEATVRSQAYEEEGLHDAYIISLSGSEFIDATKKGSLARFINHSCEPNCETRKWTVLGEVRVGIFAKQDIKAGTELTYNYNFEWYGGTKVRCRCGAAICVGFLGAKSRGFLKDSYVWEDNDERYSVENVPLYDSEDDEPLSSFFKRAQVSVKSKKSTVKDASPPLLTPVGTPVDQALEESLKENKGVLESEAQHYKEACLQIEATAGNVDQIFEEPSETPMKEEEAEIEGVLCNEMTEEKENPLSKETVDSSQQDSLVIEKANVSHKRSRHLASHRAKSDINKNFKSQQICQLLSSKAGFDDVLSAEEMEAAALAELNKLHNELRPLFEDLGKDGTDSLPISTAEKWIALTCNHWKAVVDYNYCVATNLIFQVD